MGGVRALRGRSEGSHPSRWLALITLVLYGFVWGWNDLLFSLTLLRRFFLLGLTARAVKS